MSPQRAILIAGQSISSAYVAQLNVELIHINMLEDYFRSVISAPCFCKSIIKSVGVVVIQCRLVYANSLLYLVFLKL